VTDIDTDAFYSCESLTSIFIPSTVINISNNALSYCSNLTEIQVSNDSPYYSSNSQGILFNKDKTVLLQAPGGISGSYTIPDGVTGIGDHAFYRCESLVSIEIPNSVQTIERFAFWGCGSLKEIRTSGIGIDLSEAISGKSYIRNGDEWVPNNDVNNINFTAFSF
jgi:hypothetical protein